MEVTIRRDSSIAYNCCPTHVDVCAGKIPECNCTTTLSRAGGEKKKGRNGDEDDDDEEDDDGDNDEDDDEDEDGETDQSDSSKQGDVNLEEQRRKLVRERILSTGKLSGKLFHVIPSTPSFYMLYSLLSLCIKKR